MSGACIGCFCISCFFFFRSLWLKLRRKRQPWRQKAKEHEEPRGDRPEACSQKLPGQEVKLRRKRQPWRQKAKEHEEPRGDRPEACSQKLPGQEVKLRRKRQPWRQKAKEHEEPRGDRPEACSQKLPGQEVKAMLLWWRWRKTPEHPCRQPPHHQCWGKWPTWSSRLQEVWAPATGWPYPRQGWGSMGGRWWTLRGAFCGVVILDLHLPTRLMLWRMIGEILCAGEDVLMRVR